MPEDKGLGSKLLGLFIETEKKEGEEAPAAAADAEKSPADIVAELAGQGVKPRPAGPAAAGFPAAPPMPSVPRPSGPVAPATVDFDAVFKQSGMDPTELDRVRKAEELLKGLPESTPNDVKRQIVEASLKAFGFDVAKIIVAAQTQLKALGMFVKVHEQQTAKGISDAQARIAKLEDEIIGLKADIEKKAQTLAGVSSAADLRKQQVLKVLEFFNAPAVAAAATPAEPKAQ
ncbi:MAG: hypothetical protein HY906_00120 [Deltaproteobacteria bacterium]|nr:hypothetical protein [Deltaproteobacteria bacterium]